MKGATWADISLTLFGKDTLRYNFPGFLPEMHLFCLLSSTQSLLRQDRLQAIFLESTSLFCLSWWWNSCHWKGPYHTVMNSNRSHISCLEDQAESLLPAEIWELPAARVGEHFQSSWLENIPTKLIPMLPRGLKQWWSMQLDHGRVAIWKLCLLNATKIAGCWGRKVHRAHFVFCFVSVLCQPCLPLSPATGNPHMQGDWPLLLLFFPTKVEVGRDCGQAGDQEDSGWGRGLPWGRQLPVSEGWGVRERRGCTKPPVPRTPQVLPGDPVSQEGFHCPCKLN